MQSEAPPPPIIAQCGDCNHRYHLPSANSPPIVHHNLETCHAILKHQNHEYKHKTLHLEHLCTLELHKNSILIEKAEKAKRERAVYRKRNQRNKEKLASVKQEFEADFMRKVAGLEQRHRGELESMGKMVRKLNEKLNEQMKSRKMDDYAVD